MDLRGKGINGTKSDLNKESISPTLLLVTAGMFVLAIALVSVVVFHQRRTIKYNRELGQLYKAKVNELQNQLEEEFNKIQKFKG